MKYLWAILLLFPLAAFAAGGAADSFDEGIDYQLITPRPALPTGAPKGKVQVAEFFWYQCPHCANLEPKLERWLHRDKPAAADFVRVPAVLAPNWFFMARVFYTAKLLGVEQRMTPLLFKAIHTQGARAEDLDGVAKLFAKHGISERRFKQAFESLAVDTHVRRAIQLTREYGISGVPTLVVDGRYRVDPDLAGSYARMFRIVDYLVRKVQAEQAARHPAAGAGA
ncbi:thiol:disulfide interchange protein DsbA/DsbL [Acidihalobacter prosperus]|uniref:Thiol:disulfide interchange protein n=1 Tax=Acidihalobacter prosperus TaxID=160660 RepID=A0A1A6C3R1_9GAMM|nr:thiol:disulfide interchange protein DsbA/DsbL [Acidihalobacter prosperus]OBS09202.1 Periplasmic thiol:disulfide interchange protein DsbA [Acidihalobacter prosperus]